MANTNQQTLDIPNNLSQIALLIRKDWRKVNYAAEPYLSAMSRLNTIEDHDWNDSGKSIVNYFLINAASWKGEVARAVKAKLREMIA